MLHVTVLPQAVWSHSAVLKGHATRLHKKTNEENHDGASAISTSSVLCWIKTTIIRVFAAAMVCSSAPRVEVPQVDSTVRPFLDQLGVPLRSSIIHPSKINTSLLMLLSWRWRRLLRHSIAYIRDVGNGVFELPSAANDAAAAATTIQPIDRW